MSARHRTSGERQRLVCPECSRRKLKLRQGRRGSLTGRLESVGHCNGRKINNVKARHFNSAKRPLSLPRSHTCSSVRAHRALPDIRGSSLLVTLAALVACAFAFVHKADTDRITGLLASPSDLASAYYSAIGNAALGSAIPKNACSFAQKANGNDLTELFYASSIAQSVGSSCSVKFSGAASVVSDVLSNDKSEAVSVYRAVAVAKNLGLDTDLSSVEDLLKDFLAGQPAVAA